ncbi:MAG: beta-ketoacyl-ACP reductase [Bacteroidales bacterium]|nr:beta-ketoacyl-ACP reductase [Bacteroidales bacterium]
MFKFNNKITIITGGADGIGKATAIKFAAAGAVTIIWDVQEEKGKAVCAEILKNGGKAEFFKVDTSKMTEIEAAVASILKKYETIDFLINNAGITRDASFKKMTSEMWQQVIDVNLTGVFNCTKAIAPIMLDKGFGKIVNASSVVGLYGNFGQTNYVATKAGIIGMTKTWAREFGRKGVNVNAVAPGFTMTEMVAKMPEKVLDDMKTKVPLGRLATPEEMADAYMFLCSDFASYINGHTLSVDGGMTV